MAQTLLLACCLYVTFAAHCNPVVNWEGNAEFGEADSFSNPWNFDVDRVPRDTDNVVIDGNSDIDVNESMAPFRSLEINPDGDQEALMHLYSGSWLEIQDFEEACDLRVPDPVQGLVVTTDTTSDPARLVYTFTFGPEHDAPEDQNIAQFLLLVLPATDFESVFDSSEVTILKQEWVDASSYDASSTVKMSDTYGLEDISYTFTVIAANGVGNSSMCAPWLGTLEGVENGNLESSVLFIIGGAAVAVIVIPTVAFFVPWPCIVPWQRNKKNTKRKELVQMVNQDDDTQKNKLAETNGSPKGSWAAPRTLSSPKSDIENQAANGKGKAGKKKGVGAGASLRGSIKKKRKGGR